MSLLSRGVVFAIGTVTNAILYLFHSRVVMEVLAIGESFSQGPATSAMQLLPAALQLAMAGLQVGLVVYFLGGIGEERASSRRPMP